MDILRFRVSRVAHLWACAQLELLNIEPNFWDFRNIMQGEMDRSLQLLHWRIAELALAENTAEEAIAGTLLFRELKAQLLIGHPQSSSSCHQTDIQMT